MASSSVNEDENVETIDVSAFAGELQTGLNILAVHGLNRSLGSSDFLVDVVPVSYTHLTLPTICSV